jgi:hypothetical protein
MKENGRLGKSQKPARKRTSRGGAVVPREAWSARLSWRVVRVRAAVVHAFAHARERARRNVHDLRCRAASARARLVSRLRLGQGSTSELLRPALVSVGVAALVLLAFGAPWRALAAGGWTFAIALLLALRSAQQRNAVAVQHELYQLREQLRVTHRNGVAVQHELYELGEQLRVTQALIQVDELEDVEEVDLSDEPTRAVPRPKPTRPGWRKRFGLHWPASR